jgi:hypothetical protein
MPLKVHILNSPVLAQDIPLNSNASPINIKQKGEKVLIKQKIVNLPWIEWQEGNQSHIGISDVGAETILGIELLNTTESNQQPIQWFNYYQTLAAKFVNPYRYIDLTDFVEKTQIKLVVDNDLLTIDIPSVQLNKAYEIPELKGKKIIVELNRPTFFQVSQGRDQGFVTINSEANPAVLEQFKPIEPEILPNIEEDEGDKITGRENQEQEVEKPLFTVTSTDEQTLMTINLPPAHNLRVTSASPNLLFIELKPDALLERRINWSDDIDWQKKYVTVNSSANNDKKSLFLVNYLTFNLTDYNLDILPITTNQNTVVGTAPLHKTAQQLGAIAAINGGFFNRNNKLPLGALKNREKWLSSPILNRGVIAWDELGKVKMGRLELQETINIANGDRFVITYLNSGYVQPGISRYNPHWGVSYTTLSDDEIIVVVEKDRIKEQITTGKAGEDTIPIPPQGYLLTLRKVDHLADKFELDREISVQASTIPPDFAKYPYIMGAGPLLLLNRQVVLDGAAEQFSEAFNQQKASRSAIAINSEGELMFVAVHNRIGGVGPSLLELAQILKNMGAVNALNLDGGSSTQIYLGGQIIDRSAATAASVNNGIGVFLRKRD